MAAQTTHTPGPWKFDGGLYVRYGDWPVATINGTTAEREANARLIAVAPDYDAMARALVKDADIALAPGSRDTFMDLVNLLAKHRKAARAAILKAEGK